MIVALDVGNTKIALGVIRGGDVAAARRAPTREAMTAHGAAQTLSELLEKESASLADVSEVWLASVVPAVTEAITELCQGHDIKLTVADHSTIPMGMRIEAAETAGQDRLVNAFAAMLLYGAPVIVVDIGTATTFDVVDRTGAFLGGAIAPGVELGLDALASQTAQLPRVRLALPPRVIGRRTVEALQSGAVLGHIGMVDHMIRSISAELATMYENAQPKVILTGGLSNTDWARTIPGVDAIEPLLTLRGLALLKRELMALPKVAHS